MWIWPGMPYPTGVPCVGRLQLPIGQTKWEKVEESVGLERITEGKEWGRRVDVTLG